MTNRPMRADRRANIAAAGVRVIATGGVRALTHRAIDAELGLPTGSTSYYARTRRDLITLVVERLATRTTTDMSGAALPDKIAVPEAAMMIARWMDAMMTRSDDHLARIALHIEYRTDPDTLATLAGNPPLRPRLIAAAANLLRKVGVDGPATYAADLVALMDSLLMQEVVKDERLNIEAIVCAYLSGLPQSDATHC
ncbi:TetR family transcriptional regulator [Agreia pratensis]|uniref:TetR/AcrR family transcriptional regulator n=1 Tax=Microbacteriaceae TaxID=85023 RepID=UPI00188D6CBF|nr:MULTISPECIES: TetR family transcriptional regulator [Microbacteriaceae]MBF4561241.1 TetR family transcriptional regulator [Microbacterium sp. VKM Ac-2870]MBF4633870.1 TetR family transcriptional regulator [Agreia pratensis]